MLKATEILLDLLEGYKKHNWKKSGNEQIVYKYFVKPLLFFLFYLWLVYLKCLKISLRKNHTNWTNAFSIHVAFVLIDLINSYLN